MLHFIIIGTDELAQKYIRLIQTKTSMKVIALVDNKQEINSESLARKLNVNIVSVFDINIHKHTDYIIHPIENGEFLEILSRNDDIENLLRNNKFTFNDLIATRIVGKDYLQLACNDLEEGLIIIDEKSIVRFVNTAVTKMLNQIDSNSIGHQLKNIMPEARLPNVLETRTNELQDSFKLKSGIEVISSRYPIINSQNRLVGAYAFLQKKSSIIKNAKQFTDYNKFREILTSFINISNHAISFVDELGYLKMCNEKYATLVNTPKVDLIDQQATRDIFEGNNVHFEAAKARRPLNNLKMTIGTSKFRVNATPVIIKGKLKGSLAIFDNVTKICRLENERNTSKQIIRNLEKTFLFKDVIYHNSEMNTIMEQAKFAANTEVSILLKGDKGTGKSLLANAIHNESNRKYNRFVYYKCRLDKFDLVDQLSFANGGTIFIDDIKHLNISVQKDLLDILKGKVLNDEKFSVRVIVSSNINLEYAVTNNEFLQELLTVINTISITLPRLNDRKADLSKLIDHFIQITNQLADMNIERISEAALELLTNYSWPGNIAELKNVIRLAANLMSTKEQVIDVNHLPSIVREKESTQIKEVQTLQEVMDEYESNYIKSVYELHQGNKTQTAKVLGISVRNLYYKLDKYQLD